MMTHPTQPMGRPLSEADAAAQERILGRYAPEGDDAIALRDARGLRFQRLEWLGDSILDLIAAEHRTCVGAAPDAYACCADGAFETSDATLGRLAEQSGLTHIANWELTTHRAADLAEAVVGAVFRQFGWNAARTASAVLHPGLANVVGVGKGQRHRRRVICELGAQVFDTSASIEIFKAEPEADESELHQLRSKAISNALRAEIASNSRLRRDTSRLIEDAADDLDYMLGQRCLSEGIERAVSTARSLTETAKP